jgi:hypothetical protein
MAGSRANWEDMVMPTLIARDKELIASRRKAEAEAKTKEATAKPTPKPKAGGIARVDKALKDAGVEF